MTDLSVFQKKIAERKAAIAAAEAAEAAAKAPSDPEFADLVPEDAYERTETDVEIDRIVDRIDIVEAYTRYCGKMVPKVRPGQVEGIKVSCPVPGHQDEHPSAWLNRKKHVWYCEPCGQGGDALDLAAFAKGYPVPGYKAGASFPKLRAEIATDYGLVVTRMAGGVTIATAPDENSSSVASVATPEADNSDNTEEVTPSEPAAEEETPAAPVISITFDEELITPTLDWEKVVPHDTFLDVYMRQTRLDDLPEEYHFWHALLALGLALGRDVTLDDYVAVKANLFICLLGRSGAGKSKARHYLDTLLARALPYDNDDPFSKGAKRASSIASAEMLVKIFQKDVTDPSDPKKVLFQAPVRGLVDYGELSGITGRANRQGNVLKPTLMELYDCGDTISSSSLTTGAKKATFPFGSALTTTQPKALRDLVTEGDDNSGFLNRWFFACGGDKQRVAIGGIKIDILPAVKPLQAILGWAGTFRPGDMITWSPEAEDKFTEFFHKRIEVDKKNSTSGMLARLDLLTKKLILLFTANRMLNEVPVESVEEAIFCYDYLLACYKFTEGRIGNSIQSDIVDRVMLMSAKLKNGVTAREVAASLKNKKYPIDQIRKVIDNLAALGLIEAHTVRGTRGPTTVRYRYVK